MKRIFAIISVLALLACCITPAFATSVDVAYDGNLINYFDYYNGDLNFTLQSNENSITFDLPTTTDLRYLDFTFFCWQGYGLSDVIVTLGGYSSSLTLEYLSSGIIRAYGLPPGSNSMQDHFTLTFVFSYSFCKISFFSFKYSSTTFSSFPETGALYAQPSNISTSISMPNANTPVSINFTHPSSTISNFYSWVTLNNWRKYDSMDVLLKVDSGGLSSICVSIDDLFLPFSITGYDSSNGSINYVEWDYDSVLKENIYYFNYEFTYQWVLIHIDLSNVPRHISDSVQISLTGNVSANNSSQGIVLSSVQGYFEIDTISPLGYFFKDLKDFLSDLFKPNNSTQDQIDSSIQENESIDQEISDGISDVGEDLDDIDVGTNITEIGADPSHFISFFTIIFNNYYILRIFWIAALMMILGYIFHGQR